MTAVYTPCQYVSSLPAFSPLRGTVQFAHSRCHRVSTRDHICYFVEDKAKDERAVFTG